MEYTIFKLRTSHCDKDKADFAVGFIECLCHTKGRWAGKPFKLLPWQEQLVRDIFGTVKADGKRQFITSYIEIPKKNGKSELAAAIALYMFFADGEASPEVYGAAADCPQAAIVFYVANQMVKLTPALAKSSKILGANKCIVSLSLGETITLDKVQAACDSVRQNLAEENTFRQLRLNQWVRQSVRWMPMEKWDRCNFAVDEESLEGMGFKVVPFGQGFKDMSPPTKELMKLTLEERIAHGGHPVLRWNMDNIFIRRDPVGNIKADKEKSTEKIDGTIATIMALDRAIRCGLDAGESVYENRGILMI